MRSTRARVLLVGLVLAAVPATQAGAAVTAGTRSAATWNLDARRGADIVTTLEPHVAAIIPGSRSGPNAERSRVLDDYDLKAHAFASGDVNGDGIGDLLVGDPAHTSDKGVIAVYLGSPGGPRHADRYLLQDPRTYAPTYSSQRLGAALAVADIDRDGYDDVISTRRFWDNPAQTSATWQMIVFWGARTDLSFERSEEWWSTEFDRGVMLAVGNVRGDERLEVLALEPGTAGSADAPQGEAGELWTCAVGFRNRYTEHPRWLGDCDPRPTAGGINDIAVGDVAGSRRDDVLLGQPIVFDEEGTERGGVVWLHRGSTDGVANAVPVTQATRGVPGTRAAGNEFGAALVIGDINDTGKHDVLVGVPGELRNAGSVAVLYGHRDGLGAGGGRRLHQGTPGVLSGSDSNDRFGGAVSLLDVDGDGDLDTVVGAPGENAGRGAIFVLPTHADRPAPRRSVRLTPTDVTDRHYSYDKPQGFGRIIGR